MNKINKEPEKVELTEEQLASIQSKISGSNLDKETQELLVKTLQGMIWLSKMLEAKKMSIKKLARLFGFKTEKNLFEKPSANKEDKKDNEGDPPKSSGGGQGRNGHDKYPGAKRVFHEHSDLKVGMRCPECARGNLYEIKPGNFVTVKGQAPLSATVHVVQKLRCSGCGKIFTAETPKDVRKQKYDETSDVAIALMKYTNGVPFYRMGQWQKNLGIPLPPSTAWERAECLASSAYPVYNALIRHAGQVELAYIDDTGAKILDLKKRLRSDDAERTGIYTTGIVAMKGEREIRLFMTGNKHAGENLNKILEYREKTLSPLITMSDALPSNHAKVYETIESLCMTHGRRGFVDAQNKKELYDLTYYPIQLLGKIYYFDKVARERKMNDEERLAYHQKKSGPVIKKLRQWCLRCFYLRKVEPNAPVGTAIQYMLNHWKGLTEFLRTPGVPISNEIAERLLKRAILHRKNSLFFKSELGAYVADVIMSLAETCRAAGKNMFEYLLAVHRNKKLVHKNPDVWLPWNFEATLAGLAPMSF